MTAPPEPPPTGRCPPWSAEAVLAWCASSRFDGALAFARGEARRLIPFRAGRVDTRALPAEDALDAIRWMIDGGPGSFELLRAHAAPPEAPREVLYYVDRAPARGRTASSADRTERLFVPTPRVVPDALRALGYGAVAVVLGAGFAVAVERLLGL